MKQEDIKKRQPVMQMMFAKARAIDGVLNSIA